MENKQLERKQLWKTKNFLIFNVALACLIAGFAIGIHAVSKPGTD